MKNITLKPFTADNYKSYVLWFKDSLLNNTLGPINDEWLEHILTDDTGQEWAAMVNETLVGVVGTLLPTEKDNAYAVTNIAVRPDLRSSGYAKKILELLFKKYATDKTQKWICFVSSSNHYAKRFFQKNGWNTDNKVDENNMILFCKCQTTSTSR